MWAEGSARHDAIDKASACQCVSEACSLCVGGEDGEEPVDDGPFRLDSVDRLQLY
jgi:hypothetical protein